MTGRPSPTSGLGAVLLWSISLPLITAAASSDPEAAEQTASGASPEEALTEKQPEICPCEDVM